LSIASRRDGSQPSQFRFPRLRLDNLVQTKAINIDVTVSNPQLIGSVDVAGSVGALNLKDVKGMGISGTFRLRDLDLSTFKKIAGTPQPKAVSMAI
jgi:hypothetical protein